MAGTTSKRYPPELRERAVRMVAEIAGDHESEWAAMGEEAAELKRLRRAETGQRDPQGSLDFLRGRARSVLH